MSSLVDGGLVGLPVPASGGSFAIGSTVTSGTTGSVLFVGASSVLAQDNANLFWDDTNNRLGIGTAAPGNALTMADTTDASGAGSTIGSVSLAGGLASAKNIVAGTGFWRYKSANGTTAAPVTDFLIGWTNNNGSQAGAGLYALNSLSSNSASWLQLKTNNTTGTLTTAVTIDAAQQVGIGIILPLMPLHIATTTANVFQIERSGTQVGKITATSNEYNFLATSNIRFGAGGAGAVASIVGANGLFGIGGAAASGTPGAQLEVDATAAGTIGQIIKAFASQTANLFQWQNSAGTVLSAVDKIGYIGIGTATPLGLLHASGSSTSTDLTVFDGTRSISVVNIDQTVNNIAGFVMRTAQTDGTIVTGGKINTIFAAHTNSAVSGHLTFSTNNAGTVSEKMRILNTGNVGIGTNAPATTLDVSGITTFRGANVNVAHTQVDTTNSGIAASGNLIIAAGSSGIIRLFTGGTGGTEILRTTSGGNVGIGTASPNANAILDLTSTTKPFMPPRMTTTQRDAVASPTAGMVVYNSTTNKLNVYTTAWEAITSI